VTTSSTGVDRAFTLAESRLARLSAEVNGILVGSAPLGALLQRTAEVLVRHLGAAFARVWTLDESERVLELRASAGLYTHLDGPHARVPLGTHKIGRIAEERAPHLTNEVQSAPWVDDPEWAKREGMVAFAGCPMIVEARLVGVLALFARDELAPEVLHYLESVALAAAQCVERKRAQAMLQERLDQLARSNEELERFAYVASHDLQEPLRMVVSYMQLLKERYHGQLDERADRYIDYAVDGGKRMQQLINDLLTYSRAGRGERPFEPVDCNRLADDVLRSLRVAIGEAGARVTRGELPTVLGDASQLGQLLQNLFGNAIKYRAPDREPAIALEAELVDDAWRFALRDNGIGIEPRFLERVFIIFQRLHRKEEYAGTGVGLAICRRVVERHGGRIWVESAPGRGSTFYFTLPTAPKETR
jgi:signal transduction histidine kinase